MFILRPTRPLEAEHMVRLVESTVSLRRRDGCVMGADEAPGDDVSTV